MGKLGLISVLVAVLFFGLVPGVLAQDPGDFGEPSPLFKAPWVLEGYEEWLPPVEPVDFAAAAAAGECDYVPEWVDHFAGATIHPNWPTTGSMEDILWFTGIQIDTSYGCDVARPGEQYLAVAAIEGRCGNAGNIIVVKDAAGNPLEGVLLFLHWPNMGDASTIPSGQIDPPVYLTAIGGFTNGDGTWGTGFGPGSFIVPGDPGQGGPFTFWPSACPRADCRYGPWVVDVFRNTGWMGGTDHCTFNAFYEVRVKEGGTSPPIPADDAWLGVFEQGELLYHVPLVPGMPGGNFDGFSGLGHIDPGGAWLWHVDGVIGAPPGE